MVPQMGFAAEPEKSSALSQVIIETKAQVSVPKELTEFDYRESEEGYDLNWHDEEEEKFLEVSCTDTGMILRYSYSGTEGEQKAQNISYEEAQKKAQAFLKKTAKAYESELVLQTNVMPNQGETYGFTYDRVHNGFKVLDEEVEVQVDKQTGEVTYFRGINYHAASQYDTAKPTLTLEEAKKIYLSEIGLEKAYRIYQEKPNHVINFLVYQVNNREGKGISAVSGKIVKPYGSYSNKIAYATEETTLSKDSMMDTGSGLSPAEQKAVQERKEFVEAEKVKEQASAYFPALKGMKITSSRLSQADQLYIRDLEFRGINDIQDEGKGENAYLSVNALTGEVIDFDYYVDHEDKKAGSEWNQDQAADFIKKVAPNEAGEVSLKDKSKEENEAYQNFQFERKANGIGVVGNGMRLTYDTCLQQVTSYHKNWSNTQFKPETGSLSKDQAIEKIGLEPFYMRTDKNAYTLVYNHEQSNLLLDAFTGEKVNYRGEKIEEKTGCLYTDIKGNPYERAIENLYYNGIYLNREQLYPNAAITQEEMLSLLEQAVGSEEEVYTFAKESGWIDEGEKSPTHKLTREEGIKLLVSATVYGKIAKMEKLYQYPYKDEKVDPALKGYITVAYGLGWLPQQSKLEPKANLSRGEAMHYIDKALEVLSGRS